MIDIRVTVVGDKEIVDTLKRAPGAIRESLVSEMNTIGQEITSEARRLAPVKTGLLRDSIRFGAWADSKNNAELLVRPRGAPHAHLIERGVPRQKIRVYRAGVYAQKLQKKFTKANGKIVWRFKRANRVKNKQTFLYTRMHQITPHPFFMPAVESAGDVGARLQAALAAAAESLAARGTP